MQPLKPKYSAWVKQLEAISQIMEDLHIPFVIDNWKIKL